LKSYFDPVKHHILLDNVAKRIADDEIMQLLKQIRNGKEHSLHSFKYIMEYNMYKKTLRPNKKLQSGQFAGSTKQNKYLNVHYKLKGGTSATRVFYNQDFPQTHSLSYSS
jgi:hypothetical protein